MMIDLQLCTQCSQCCMEWSIIIHHEIQDLFVKKYGFTKQEQSMSRARMQIQGQNTQIHKVRPNTASVSHRDEQESITIIKMNSKWSDLSVLSLVFISNRWFSLVFIKLTMKNQRKPSLVMMRECPCSTKTREVLENPSPPPSRFPSAIGFAPLDPRVSWCKTNGRGKSLKISLDPREFLRARSREISRVSGNLGRRGWIFQYLPPLGGARIQTFQPNFTPST